VPVPPLGKDRAGRACGLWNVSDWSLPVAALRLWQRTTEGEFYGELSTPAPESVALRSLRFPVQLEVAGSAERAS
jgi:hypothetical protein